MKPKAHEAAQPDSQVVAVPGAKAPQGEGPRGRPKGEAQHAHPPGIAMHVVNDGEPQVLAHLSERPVAGLVVAGAQEPCGLGERVVQANLEVIRRGRPGGLLHLAHGVLEFMLRQEHAAQMEVQEEEMDPGMRAAGRAERG